MRLRTVSIRSFGGIHDRTFHLSSGLNVFHGPNESGKTTTMEFIRSTLVPSNRRNQYPERAKGDSGTIVYEEDGETREVSLSHKKRTGDVPAMPNGTDDPDLYRKVFAMTPSDLDDEGSVDRLKSRFLTVPGGERMPEAIERCSDEADSLLGRQSNSRSAVNDLDGRLEELDSKVAGARSQVNAYGELSRQLADLESRAEAAEREHRADDEARRIFQLYRSQRGNYSELEGRRVALAELGDFRRVSGEDLERYQGLRTEVASARAASDSVARRQRELSDGLMGADARAVAREAPAIDLLPGRLESYRRDREAIVRQPGRAEPVRREVRRTNPLVYAGAVLAVIGLIGCMVSVYSIALTAAGVVVAVAGLMRPRTSLTYSEPEPVPDTAAAYRESAEAFEREVSGIVSRLNLISRGTETDVSMLVGIRNAAGQLNSLENEAMKARLALNDAELELTRFLSGFGGEEGFKDSVERTRRAESLEAAIGQISSAISNAGLDPEVPDCPVEYQERDTSVRDGINIDIGSVRQRMKGILGERELERLMDQRAGLAVELRRALSDGAVALLAGTIADDACEDIYSSVQPGVASTADRYLGLMTDGRYRLDVNPRSDRLTVRSEEGSKDIARWSSGLRAQVLLSVKLAIAREMGEGRVPVILDDVLLPFDSERKAGACRALAELSSEMQVLLFTCDSETASICRSLEGVTVTEM